MWNFPPPDVFYNPENPLESDCDDGPRFSRGQSRQPYIVAPPPSYFSVHASTVEQNRLQTAPSYAAGSGTIFRLPPPVGCNPPSAFAKQPSYHTNQVLPRVDATSLSFRFPASGGCNFPPSLAKQPSYQTTPGLPHDDASSLRSSDSDDDPFLGDVPPEPMYDSCSENAANSPQAVFEEEDSPQAVSEEDDQQEYNCPSEDDEAFQNALMLDNLILPESNVPYPASERSGCGLIKYPQAPICLRRYTEQDLYPKVRDPSCDPSWQLASYWPVYMANFRVDNLEEGARNVQIASFFASKGLLTRMIFVRDSHEFYLHYQCHTMLLDMLVYFTSKQDADQAIRCCHKTIYYGHRLNLYSGRVPEYFDAHRSVGFRMPRKTCVKWTETLVELRFHKRTITTVAKFSDIEVIVEFKHKFEVKVAIRKGQTWVPFRLEDFVHKQRYLEQDVKLELLWQIQENSTFMEMFPPPQILAELKEGQLPQMDKAWENWETPRPLPEGPLFKLEKHRAARKQRLLEIGRKIRTANAAAHAERMQQQIKSKQEKMIRNQLESQRAQMRKILPKLHSARGELLVARTKSMAERTQLFYKLLDHETKVQKIVAESKGQVGGYKLETSLLKALEKAVSKLSE